jgi:hypothetical protein
MLQSDFYLEDIVDDNDNDIPFIMTVNPMLTDQTTNSDIKIDDQIINSDIKINDHMIKSSLPSSTFQSPNKDITKTQKKDLPNKLFQENDRNNIDNTNNNTRQNGGISRTTISNDTRSNIYKTGKNSLKTRIRHSFYLDENDTIIEKEIQIANTHNEKEGKYNKNNNNNNNKTINNQNFMKHQPSNIIVNENNNYISTSNLSTKVNQNIKKISLKPLQDSNNFPISNMNNSNSYNMKNNSKYFNIYSDENNMYLNTRKNKISKLKDINNKTRNNKTIR